MYSLCADLQTTWITSFCMKHGLAQRLTFNCLCDTRDTPSGDEALLHQTSSTLVRT